MKLVSRLDRIQDYEAQLVVEAMRMGIPRDAFNQAVERAVHAPYVKSMRESYGGQEQTLAEIDRRSAEINASFQAQFAFLLNEAGTKYRYRAECLLDEIRAKAGPKPEEQAR